MLELFMEFSMFTLPRSLLKEFEMKEYNGVAFKYHREL
jgi:hypothetical protein